MCRVADGATTEPVVFCQLTVRQGTRFDGAISAQGKTVGGGEDWVATAMTFDQSGSKGRRPPPPPPCGDPPAIQNGQWVPSGPRQATLRCDRGYSAQQGGMELANAGIICNAPRWTFSGAECLMPYPGGSDPPPPPPQAFDPPPPPPPPRGGGGPSIIVNEISSTYGYQTYQVGVTFDGRTTQVYALYGEAGNPLVIPPAFQVPAPFGTDSYPVNPQFFQFNLDAEFDSFLTIGLDGKAERTLYRLWRTLFGNGQNLSACGTQARR